MKKIAIITNIAPIYRSALWKMLLQDKANEYHFFYGENLNDAIKKIDVSKDEFLRFSNRMYEVKNYFYAHKVLVWQRGVIFKCLRGKYDIGIFLGDMYCISTWICSILFRLHGREVAFWGHGLYGNEAQIKLKARMLFYNIPHKFLVYGTRAKQLMVKQGINQNNIYVVFNSLDYDMHKSVRAKAAKLSREEAFSIYRYPNLPILVFIGRLMKEKKLDLLVEAVNRINEKDIRINLLIIGDGPEKRRLEDMSALGKGNKWVYFTGALYEEDEVGKYLYWSDLCVSPGNVGLNAIHALGYGTPVCTHANLSMQGPEAEAIVDGVSGCFFRENDQNDLANKIKTWFAMYKDREHVRQCCYGIIDKFYNPSYQLTVFNRLINGDLPEL
jgi:glycosyltransferase involved in cell wall biosynthesis